MQKPLAIMADDIPARTKKSLYPEPFASMMNGREKRQLGDFFGITNFGVNLTTLAPGARSALLHRHSKQQELIYILQGEPTLVTDNSQQKLLPGMCAGFIPSGAAHQLINDTHADVVYLEVGDRTTGDAATYPADDLVAEFGADGHWKFTHKNGEPY